MGRRKYKLTGFARFFIVMLFLAPIAYIAASYINGEDGIANIRQLFSGQASPSDEQTTTLDESSPEDNTPDDELSRAELEQTIYDLKDSLRAKEFEIRELRRQIRLLQGSSE